MGYWDITIENLNRVIDRAEAIATSLSGSKHTREAGDVREAKDKLREVRNDLLSRQHDIDRGKT